MNRQEVFNKVWEHAHTQKEKSLAKKGDPDENLCRYRGDNGTKCFIGALIPNEVYEEDMEGMNVANLVERFSIVGRTLGLAENVTRDSSDMRFLARLQYIHDSYPPSEWDDELRYFADTRDVRVPE